MARLRLRGLRASVVTICAKQTQFARPGPGNSKSEARNPKQIQIANDTSEGKQVRCEGLGPLNFGHWSLFRPCSGRGSFPRKRESSFVLRIWPLGAHTGSEMRKTNPIWPDGHAEGGEKRLTASLQTGNVQNKAKHREAGVCGQRQLCEPWLGREMKRAKQTQFAKGHNERKPSSLIRL
jgi:hypothetical protein